MASFTDQITQFTPYMPEEPIQAMVDVGVQKQDEFYQGVQKVQGNIDYIASLPIAKDEIKQYMQAKLGQLKQAVSTSIASDFSDQRLINQIGGLTKHIANDPIIQNGVQSTLAGQDAQEAIKQAKKDGKGYSIENEYDVMSDYQKWLNDKDPTSSFSKSYTPYIDVNKKWMDVLKQLGVSSKTEDIPFETYQKADGSIGINYDKIASVMMERGIKGVDATALENAVRSSLTPDDLNQLQISGKYQFRNYGVQDLVQKSQESYMAQTNEAQKKLVQLQKDAKLNASNPEKLNDINDQIQSLQDLLGQNGKKGQLEINHDNEMSYIQANPDAAKGELYKNGAIQEFVNAFSGPKEETLVYKDNPFTRVEEWNKQFGLEEQKFEYQKGKDAQTYDLEYKKYLLELQKLTGSISGFSTTLGVGTGYVSPVTSLKNDIQDKTNQVQATVTDVADKMGVTPDEAQKRITAYELGDGTAVAKELQGVVDNLIKTRNDAAAMQAALKKATDKATEDYFKKNPGETLQSQLQGKHSLTINTNGQKVTFTPQEMYDYLSKENIQYTPGGKGSLGQNIRSINEDALSNKEKILYNYAKDRYGSNTSSTGDKSLDAYISGFADVRTIANASQKEINNAVEKSLLPKVGDWVPKLADVEVPTEAARTHIEQIAGTALGRLQHDNESNTGLDVGDAMDWLNAKDTKNIQYKIMTQGGKTSLLMYKGSDVQKIDLNPEEAAQLPNAANILPQNLNIVNRLQLGGGNTNPTGQVTESFFKKNDFKKASGLNVTADLQQDYSEPGKFYVILNLKTPTAWRTIKMDTAPMDLDGAQQYIQLAGNAELLTQFKNAFKYKPKYLAEINEMLNKEVTK